MITVLEAIKRDVLLDVNGRIRVKEEARQLIHEIYNLPFDSIGNAQVDQILTEVKVNILKNSKEANKFVKSAGSSFPNRISNQ